MRARNGGRFLTKSQLTHSRLLLVALVCVSAFAACGEDSSGSNPAGGGEGGESTATTTEARGGTSSAGSAINGPMAGEPPGGVSSGGARPATPAGEAGMMVMSPGATGSGGTLGNPSAGAAAGGEGGAPVSNCQSATLAVAPHAWAIALDSDHVYFTTHEAAGTVQRVAIEGGTPEVIESGEIFPHSLAVANGKVFWATLGAAAGYLNEAAVTGAGRTQLAVGQGAGVFSVAADANNAYYTTNYNFVEKVPLAGMPKVDLASGPRDSMIVDLALHGSNLYWTSNGVGTFEPVEPDTAGVFGVDISGVSTAAPLLNRLQYPQFQIAVSDTSVFWNDENAIYSMPIAGGPATPVTKLEQRPNIESPVVDLAADTDSVFYSDGRSVFRVKAAGGKPEVMTSGWDRIVQLAIDAQSIYFTDAWHGVVVKLPKDASCALVPASDVAPAGAAGDTSQGGVGGDGCGGHGCVEPTPIATASHPRGLAIDADALYFTTYDNPGSVMRWPLTGGVATAIASAEPKPHDLAVDADHVFWCLDDAPAGHVIESLKNGDSRQILATGVYANVANVQSDGVFVYFRTGYSGIERVPVSGGTPTIFEAGPYGSNVQDLAVAGGEAFYVNDGIFNANYTMKLPGTAYFGRSPISGSPELGGVALAEGLDYPLYRVAVDGKYVFGVGGQSVYRGERRGGEMKPFATLLAGTTQVVDMLSDGAHLYFADLHNVYRMPVDVPEIDTLNHGWGQLGGIAVDETSLYFTDYSGGQVLQLPK